ncbi:MAG: 3'(2'),5'-bisphosphate nucleotidase [Anaerolineales bacterium]|nr:3'(2'),5'-bisphosphate nucleotidase [Anaerolineales bacterium]
MLELNTSEIRFAIKAARQAALLVKDIQAEMVTDALTKDDRSPVTIADFAAQALVAHLLKSTFPEDVLVGEENAAVLRAEEGEQTLKIITKYIKTRIQKLTRSNVADLIDYGAKEPAKRFWTVDPIDGTKGFLRGEQYAVALALIENNQVQIGVLACPNLTDGSKLEIGGPGSLIVAQRGKGTWTTNLTGSLEFARLNVSDIEDPKQARFLRSYESGHTNVSQLDIIGEVMGVAAEPVRMDSQAKYGVLAAGGGDIIFRLISAKMPDYKEKIWDQAAGSIVCEEAGGKITDLDGNPLDFSQGRTLAKNRGVVASNGKLHQLALQAIRSAEA